MLLKVHASWDPSGAKTGRWACREPNLTNIPKPQYEGNKLIHTGLRDLFCCLLMWLLIEVDYAQLEAKILALLAGDKTLLQWFADGVDIHTRTASLLLNKPDIEVTESERDLSKRARYALHYGSSIQTAWRALVPDYPSLSITDITRVWRAFAKMHPDIIEWQNARYEQARKLDYVDAPLSGRRYHFHGQIEPSKCYNIPIQMTGADAINRAMLRIHERMDWDREHILAQVHDSLVTETVKENAHEWWDIVREEMEAEIELEGKVISLTTDTKAGTNWGSLTKVKTHDDLERVLKAA